MLKLNKFEKIYIYRPFVDFRRGIHGLSDLVQYELELDPFLKYLFVFCSKNRKALKMLFWDKTGFALFHKKLEQDKYLWPVHFKNEVLHIDMDHLKEFLIGLNPWQVPHEVLNYSKI